ncbi:hypothetical protein QQS21_005132 [Conoideocrella luteorostrata]|uniref:Uncharacterized protein n=1 Tax=Conoideocrella luteorostrata TaxID=1105319 RepID=A0AAJ0CQ93_9HYPO|nr:hypothetical protein QQS21_005132 [Conoideocrella luteorostrata]
MISRQVMTQNELLFTLLFILAVVLWALSRKTPSASKDGAKSGETHAISEKGGDMDGEYGPCEDSDWSKVKPIAYRPFKNMQHVAMGIKKMPKAEWIRIDQGYLKRLDERNEIMDAYPAESIGSGPIVNPAIEELYEELMVRFLPKRFPAMFSLTGRTLLNRVTGKIYSVDLRQIDHDTMLRNLGENIEEDFYFMCPDDKGDLCLEGWIACFPGGFLTTSRKGMSMRAIHQPVPGYEQRISKGADKTLARLRGWEFIERFNWSLQTDGPSLFRVDGNNYYPELGQTIPQTEDDVQIDQCYLRVEHQTLVRLPKSQAVIFCVRSYMTTLQEIKEEGNGPLLAEASESMPHKLGDYKKRPFWQTAVYRYLKS